MSSRKVANQRIMVIEWAAKYLSLDPHFWGEVEGRDRYQLGKSFVYQSSLEKAIMQAWRVRGGLG